jgi:predicted amidophosphoribosyltransferase
VETSEEMPLQTRVASVEPQTYQAAQAPPAARPIARETPSEAAQKVTCPACKERIDGGVESCPLCGAIVSEYIVKCPGCGVDVPAVDEVCPECFTSLAEGAGQEAAETLAPSQDSIQVSGDAVEAAAETEAGRMCLVCGALLDDGAGSCPICKLPFGTELPPEIEVEREWDGIGIEVPKDYYLCPNCEAVLSDTEPTDCEVAERKWFYRAIIFLFSGLFLTSASIWVRGVTVESKSLGYSPMPIDYLINIGGWALVAVGFIFWLFSWRAAGSAKLCPSCGCDVRKDAETCPECGECFEMLEAGARAQQAQGLNGQD